MAFDIDIKFNGTVQPDPSPIPTSGQTQNAQPAPFGTDMQKKANKMDRFYKKNEFPDNKFIRISCRKLVDILSNKHTINVTNKEDLAWFQAFEDHVNTYGSDMETCIRQCPCKGLIHLSSSQARAIGIIK